MFKILLMALMLSNPNFLTDSNGTNADELLRGKIFKPLQSPSDPHLISYERLTDQQVQIFFYNTERDIVFPLTSEKPGPASGFFDFFSDYSGYGNVTAYEGYLDWRPVLDTRMNQWFAYISTEQGKPNLYLGFIDKEGNLSESRIVIPVNGSVTAPSFSPDGNQLVFVVDSELYLLTDVSRMLHVGRVDHMNIVQLTNDGRGSFFPDWSFDGKLIAYQARSFDSDVESEGIHVVEIKKNINEIPASHRVTSNLQGRDQLRPVWAPDSYKIAFYNQRSGQTLFDIGILEVDYDEYSDLYYGRLVAGISPNLANQVLLEQGKGPQWVDVVQNGHKIFGLIWVQHNPDKMNPIILSHYNRWLDRNRDFEREFSSDPDFRESVNNTYSKLYNTEKSTRLLYVSQVGGSEKLQFFDWPGYNGSRKVWVDNNQRENLIRSVIFPGLGQIGQGDEQKGYIMMAGYGLIVSAGVIMFANHSRLRSRYQSLRSEYLDAPVSERPVLAVKMNSSYNSYRNNRSNIKAAGLLAMGVWVFNVYDIIYHSKSIREVTLTENTASLERVYLRPDIMVSEFGVTPTISLSVNFK